MSLHPLTNEQQTLLDEYNSSGLTIKDFACSRGKTVEQVYYIIDKDRRIRNENTNHGFIPIPINDDVTQSSRINRSTSNNLNNLISFKMNGIDITIDASNLKQFLEVLNND